MWNDHLHEASSVVQFLYPDKHLPFIEPEIPTLHLPLRVGVAFVPAGTHEGYYRQDSSFTEAQKTELLKNIGAQFKALPFVQSIEVVPPTYLRAGGGFDNLDQLHALMGIDVIALVAYDQAQNSNDTEWSLAYWTIVGAYVVPAQKNETHTLVEAVVYDIPNRNLLFRAPGTSAIRGHSTLLRTREELQTDARQGLAQAADELIPHLQKELADFQVRIREQPDTIRIVHKPGYTGGGALDRVFAIAVLVLGSLAVRRSRR